MPLRSFQPPEDFFQELTGDNEYEDLTLEPANVQKFWTSSYLQRTLSRNLVFSGTLWIPQAGSSSGKAKVEVTGEGYEDYIVSAYATTGTGTETEDLGAVYDKVFVREFQGTAVIRFSVDGVTYGDWITCIEMESFEHMASARYVQLKRDGATDLDGEIIAYK